MAKGDPRDALSIEPVGAHVSAPTISSATTLTAPDGATKLLAQALTQNVRFTLDGSAPTASRGFLLAAGDPPVVIPLGSGTTIKVIEESATADLEYQWAA